MMKTFQRRFEIAAIPAWCSTNALLKALFEQWQLPGLGAPQTELRLRLAVRDRYLSFYADGQSVANLSVRGHAPVIAVHRKYLGETDVPARRLNDEYDAFDGDALRRLTAAHLRSWAQKARGHAKQEKRFVDHLVTANPGTIDVEMALPGDDRAKRRVVRAGGEEWIRVAPRMDLVVLQEEGGLALTFWEAKCADNGELRAKGEAIPHVVDQLSKYVDWLKLGTSEHPLHRVGADRTSEVRLAFRNAAKVLADLADIVGKPVCNAVRLWRSAANGPLALIRQPGIVVANYCPQGDAATTALFVKKAETFLNNLHAAKLAGIAIDGPITIRSYDQRPGEPLPALKTARAAI